ncbi:MAG: Stp1/IreP family PP2C-type Ser/Thr phosphatase [Oscillospiraceae bacterium]|nr:Stp1/IreP family PP2C-type Ser/Thr phosphatase [Oscillospiraceae bacterium]
MQSWALTDQGCLRSQNQDTYQMEQLDKNTLLCVVCDGMGGAKSGNVASALTAEVFTQEVKRSWSAGLSREKTSQLLQSAVKLANATVYEESLQIEELEGMGTTLVAVLIQGRHATVVNVGDSRAYKIDRTGIRQITKDHSLVQMMVDRGEIAPEEARDYPGRNYITRAVGTEPTVESDVFAIRLERGDAMLLSSDGLHNEVDDQEILFEVVHGVNNDNCCKRLFDIADKRGSPDNVTCVLVMV